MHRSRLRLQLKSENKFYPVKQLQCDYELTVDRSIYQDATGGLADERTDELSFKATVKHHTALKAEGRRERKLIDRQLSSDYDRCTVKQVESALSCSYLIYIHCP